MSANDPTPAGCTRGNCVSSGIDRFEYTLYVRTVDNAANTQGTVGQYSFVAAVARGVDRGGVVPSRSGSDGAMSNTVLRYGLVARYPCRRGCEPL
ncbi:hypothetical protein [Streptomyces sp. NPDC094149]|uniref:hypothetical protein n=1 Tax=Streptomyces sp. NPDC094149 TaxID=3155079 RepID=UPI0033190B1D